MSVTLSSPVLEAQISLAGAELVYLRDEASRDLLWDGNPAFWTGRSPLLFPIVGRLNGDRARMTDGNTAFGSMALPARRHSRWWRPRP